MVRETARECASSSRDPRATEVNAFSRTSFRLSAGEHSSDFHFSLEEEFGTGLPGRQSDSVLDCLVFSEEHKLRQIWEVVVFALLIYTATVFPYFLCFYEFGIPDSRDIGSLWRGLDDLCDYLFYIDLVVNFFFSYRSGRDEIRSLKKIARVYLGSFFFINLFACLPGTWVIHILLIVSGSFESNNDVTGSQKAVRLLRLQRISRLARLTRIIRLSKIVTFAAKSALWRFIQGSRGVRLGNLLAFLCFTAHMCACGLYLVSALSEDPEEGTWVTRRQDMGGKPLYTTAPSVQWLNALYFVFTIFTTVGFGDNGAYAVTTGEIIYICIVMLIGELVYSIVTSEMINVLTVVSEDQENIDNKVAAVAGFASHIGLDSEASSMLQQWVADFSASTSTFVKYDRDTMFGLFMDGTLPRCLMGELPSQVFDGMLARNNLMAKVTTSHGLALPPKLPLLVAVAVRWRFFEANEVVYGCNDYPYSVFLVTHGTFAEIARPTCNGGQSRWVQQDIDNIRFATRDWMSPRGDSDVQSSKASGDSIPISDRMGDSKGSLPEATEGRTTWQRDRLSCLRSLAARRPSLAEECENEQGLLWPYKLYSHKAFFGMLEVLSGGERRATLRCEKKRGQVLCLPREHFLLLRDEFPKAFRQWRVDAYRSDGNRRTLLGRLKVGRNYRVLAASIIQREFRSRHPERTAVYTPAAILELPIDDAHPQSSLGFHRAGSGSSPAVETRSAQIRHGSAGLDGEGGRGPTFVAAHHPDAAGIEENVEGTAQHACDLGFEEMRSDWQGKHEAFRQTMLGEFSAMGSQLHGLHSQLKALREWKERGQRSGVVRSSIMRK